LLARPLPTVLQQDLPSGQFEVILVDDHSSDATSRVLTGAATSAWACCGRFHEFGAARNTAIEPPEEVAVSLDDDLLCELRLLR
jgi:glycosyltransferase involved in cell wall biosynthesis